MSNFMNHLAKIPAVASRLACGYRIKSVEKGRVTLTRTIRRRGSILVLVVVLLVLVALMGTAYLITTRTDRYTALQNQTNTQIDLLVDGVREMVVSQMVTDLKNGDSTYTTALRNTTSTNGVAYLPTDCSTSSLAADDLYLAERIPTSDMLGAITVLNWGSVTWPNQAQPTNPYSNILPPSLGSYTKAGVRFEIGSASVNGTVVPELRYWLPSGAAASSWIPAADADNDGIADAFYWEIPGAVIDGVKYYAACRIIDLNSAINVNTAYLPGYDFTIAGSPVAETNIDRHMFLSHIGLEPLLRNATEAQHVRDYKLGADYETVATAYLDDPGHTAVPAAQLQWQTQGDVLYHQIGRRLDNPGFYKSGSNYPNYQAFPLSDTLSLASRFCVVNPNNSPSVLEGTGYLNTSLRSGVQSGYLANQSLAWYADNFAYPAANNTMTAPLRALTVTRNPTANFTPRLDLASLVALGDTRAPTVAGTMDSASNKIPDYNANNLPAPRVSINTATFDQLWRGFYGLMATAPNTASGDSNTAQFKSVTRQTGTTGTPANYVVGPDQVKLLRSAIAAVNAESLRGGTAGNPPMHTFTMTIADASNTAATSAATVSVYGHKPQPYITEVYANTNTESYTASPADKNSGGYVAIELYNPYPFAISVGAAYQLAYRDRSAVGTAATADRKLTNGGVSLPDTIPSHGYVLVDNIGGGGAKYRPTSSGLLPSNGTPTGFGVNDGSAHQYVSAPKLDTLITQANSEFMVLRQDATGQTTGTGNNEFTVPVDSYDFSGIALGDSTSAKIWHYSRFTNSGENSWYCVWPGAYSAATSPRFTNTAPPTTWNVPGVGNEPTTVVNVTLTAASQDNPSPTVPQSFVTQMWGTNWPGTGTGTANFPFGGFARVGDILQVPFMGSYRIVLGAGANPPEVEVNSVAMDSFLVEDGDGTDDALAAPAIPEQLGRFCPVGDPSAGTFDFGTTTANYRYSWATRLADFFTTIANPNDDYLPASPRVRTSADAANRVPNTSGYDTANGSGSHANQQNEDGVAIHGLVNVNTAPWKVLAQIPFVPYPVVGSTTTAATVNEDIAKAIVDYRKNNGAFRSLYDLLKVAKFRDPSTASGWAGTFPTNFGRDANATAWGDFSDTGGNDVTTDFEDKFMMVNRVSNLLTTRSDGFIVYILVDGYRSYGTAGAHLEARRRLAYYVDRSVISPTVTSPRLEVVPTR